MTTPPDRPETLQEATAREAEKFVAQLNQAHEPDGLEAALIGALQIKTLPDIPPVDATKSGGDDDPLKADLMRRIGGPEHPLDVGNRLTMSVGADMTALLEGHGFETNNNQKETK